MSEPSSEDNSSNKVSDAVKASWVYRLLPQSAWPYAQLARWERPIGWWLLMWPCWWSFTLAMIYISIRGDRSYSGDNTSPIWQQWLYEIVGFVGHIGPTLILFMIGAIAMRGAGCTYNDLVDQEIDDKVARTRSRPLPSGRVTRTQAKLFLVAQALVGLVVLLQFNWFTVALGCLSLVTVVIYPFMKRITWWPQLFLGLAFSWGALMGWFAVIGDFLSPSTFAHQPLVPFVLYAGCILWVIGYDTIYAHQDIEDDALVGVKSTARLFGDNTKLALILLYGGAWLLFAFALYLTYPYLLFTPAGLGLVIGGAHMAWQIATLDIGDPARCLKLFKSNSHFGWILFLGLLAVLFLLY